jgi:hypothetical protein
MALKGTLKKRTERSSRVIYFHTQGASSAPLKAMKVNPPGVSSRRLCAVALEPIERPTQQSRLFAPPGFVHDRLYELRTRHEVSAPNE